MGTGPVGGPPVLRQNGWGPATSSNQHKPSHRPVYFSIRSVVISWCVRDLIDLIVAITVDLFFDHGDTVLFLVFVVWVFTRVDAVVVGWSMPHNEVFIAMLSDGWMVNGTVAFLAFRAERNEAKCLEVVARVQLSRDGFVELDDGLSVARVVHHGDGHDD